jgi:hypothetical protein
MESVSQLLGSRDDRENWARYCDDATRFGCYTYGPDPNIARAPHQTPRLLASAQREHVLISERRLSLVSFRGGR